MSSLIEPSVRDVMTRNPLSLKSDVSVFDAARAMRDKNIGSVIVIDADGQLYGIATDRDIVVRAVAAG